MRRTALVRKNVKFYAINIAAVSPEPLRLIFLRHGNGGEAPDAEYMAVFRKRLMRINALLRHRLAVDHKTANPVEIICFFEIYTDDQLALRQRRG